MEGQIGVTSEPGQGSSFTFTVRLRHQASAECSSPAGEPIELRNLPVLVVEDGAVHRRILQETLLQWDMRPTVVSSPRLALEALRQARDAGLPFALVLVDALMQEMDGFDLARAIRREPLDARVPIVMLSSSARRGDGARCREVGISGYLAKPIRSRDLLDVIATVLGLSSQQSERGMLVTRHTVREKAALGSGLWALGKGGRQTSREAASPCLSTQLPAPRAQSREAKPAFDRTALLARVEGDEELLGDLIALFLQESPSSLSAIRAAVAAGDAEGVAETAHALKGAVANFSAPAALAAASRLEEIGRSRNLGEAGFILERLAEEMECLQEALRALGTGAEAPADSRRKE
jgi:CheY-like chemotaxis protein